MSNKFPEFSALALGNDAYGDLHLICVGVDRQVYLAAKQGAGEGNDWTVPKGNALAGQTRQFTDVALGNGNQGTLQVVGLATDGHLYLAAYLDVDGEWHVTTVDVPVPLTLRRYSALAAAVGNQDSLYVCALDRDDKRLYLATSQNSLGIWTQASDIPFDDGSRTYSTFALARGDGGNLQLLALGEEDRLLYLVAEQNSGGWSAAPPDINPIGGPTSQYTALTAAQGYDGKLRVVALGTDRKVYQAAYQANGDGSWQATVLPLGDPSAVYADLRLGRGPDGSLQAICLGTDNAIYLAASFEKSDGKWHNGDAAINPLGGRGDRKYVTYVLGRGYANSLQIVAIEAQPKAGTPYLAAWLDGATWRDGRSLAQGDPTRWNPRLRDVAAAFEAVPDEGKDHVYYDNPQLPSEGFTHIQGAARYGSYYLLTHDIAASSLNTGVILLYSAETGWLKTFDTPIPGYKHPGGIQVIGDYLVLPVEQGASSWVAFGYIGAMSRDHAPTFLPVRIRRETIGAGAAGITDVGSGADRRYVVAVYDHRKITMYRSNRYPLDDPSCAFAELFTAEADGRGADNLCLLTDVNDKVYVVAFTSDDFLGFPKYDFTALYLVDFAAERFVMLKERQMYTNGKFPIPVNDVHFRYGAGLTIKSESRLQFYCTDRNPVAVTQINTFGA